MPIEPLQGFSLETKLQEVLSFIHGQRASGRVNHCHPRVVCLCKDMTLVEYWLQNLTLTGR